MSVYVDPLMIYPNAWGPFLKGSCHLVADSEKELHEFAARIGLRRSWHQPGERLSHYDLTSGKRAVAVRAGAVEITFRQLVARMRGRCPEPKRPAQGDLFAASGEDE